MVMRAALIVSNLVALAAGLPLLGCAADACPGLESCDIRRASCQLHTAAVTRCLSGNDTGEPRVNVVNAPSYVEQRTAEAEAEPETEDLRDERQALALLNLMPAERDVAASQAEIWSRVAAFYDSDTGEITVLDRGQPLDSPNLVVLLLHEMVHAAQDQRDDAYELRAGDDDGALARRALTEGEAVLYEDLATALGYGYEASDFDWGEIFATFQDRSLDQNIATDQAYLMSRLYFPYAFGGAFLQRVWRQGGNAAVRDLFADPPRSTRQVLAGHGAPPPQATGLDTPPTWREDPTAVGSPVLPPEYQLVTTSNLGAWLFELFRQRRLNSDAPAVSPLGEGFLGDVLNVFRGPTPGEVALYWRLRFESEARAEALTRELALAPLPALAYVQSGRDVVIAASNSAPLTLEQVSGLEWVPVALPMTDSSASSAESASPYSLPSRWRICPFTR
jgi:hypothetical protein